MGHWVDVPFWQNFVTGALGAAGYAFYDALGNYIYKKRNK